MSSCSTILGYGFILCIFFVLLGFLLLLAQARGRATFHTSVATTRVTLQAAVWFIPMAVGFAIMIIAFVLASPFCGLGV
jgi:hypothetical protein